MSKNDPHWLDSNEIARQKDINRAYEQGQKDYASGNTGFGGGRPAYGATELLLDRVNDHATAVTQAHRDGWNHAKSQRK